MAMRTPDGTSFGPGPNRAACLAELTACIAEAEASSSAQAATVAILALTGYDTTDLIQALWRAMDALAILREVHDHLRAG